MTEIRLIPEEAPGQLAKAGGQLDSPAAAAGGGGVDPRITAAVGDQVNGSQQAITDAGGSAKTGEAGATALGDQDQANATKTGGGNNNLEGPLGKKGGLGDGAGRGGPRLGSAELAKLLGAGDYQSSMPTSQTAPSMPQMPNIPTQALTAPTQAMMGAPGAISPLLNQLLERAAASPIGDGGPPSQTMGATLPGHGGRVQDLVSKTVGIPYAWGGGGLDGPSRGISDGGGPADRAGDYNKVGFDCSGYARYITYQATGHEIPRTSEAQYAAGMPISASQAQPGDLFFPSSAGRPPGHVQVYIGNSQVAEAPSSGQTVKISPLQPGEFRRMVV
ncbi:C40 family peptidase [Mycobacterium avium]|uniref:C40 family peptidase n=1 Tax=Mycobacterium avium TaxID=1764 RepID=UPI000BAF8809|nr:C40 family peptidase [Mycobacterium avium]PBA69048.1 cell wall-associated hydrolase, invasion-associated protein [Mycobacterium avium]